MRLLIDTHTLIWWLIASPRLSRTAIDLISDRVNEVLVSAASAYEIGNKQRIGQPVLPKKATADLPKLIRSQGFRLIDLSFEQMLNAALLRGGHRDPFDRMLAAQSLDLGVPVVTVDRQIAGFGAKVVW
jgi:PIN domain nuclease of toxin-antitoxin system